MRRPKANMILEANIMKKGDTNETLAGYLGKDKSTVANKRNGDSDWNVGEMMALSRRYEFTEAQFLEAFFPELFE